MFINMKDVSGFAFGISYNKTFSQRCLLGDSDLKIRYKNKFVNRIE